jgi:hypothetical protein
LLKQQKHQVTRKRMRRNRMKKYQKKKEKWLRYEGKARNLKWRTD